MRVGGAGRSVDKGRVGGVGILLGEWIDIGGLDISFGRVFCSGKLTELESFT